MKKTLLYCLTALFSLLYSCSDPHPDYFLTYYPGIYNAEKYVLDSLYEDALIAYKTTFKKVPFVFGRDYYNATACAVLTGKYDDAFHFLEKLAEQGAHLDWLARQHIIQPLKTMKAWDEFVEKYPALRKSYEKNYNLELKAELITMDSVDQHFRVKLDAYSLYMDTIHRIDQANASKLWDIIAHHGYPGERIIGICDSVAVCFPGDYVLVHQAPSTLPYTSPIKFDSLITEAREGRISPHTLAHYLDRKKETFIFDNVSLAVCKAIVTDSIIMNNPDPEVNTKLAIARYAYIKRTETALEQFDKKRASLGLEPFDEFRKKVYLGQIDSIFLFQYMGGVSFYHFIHEKDRQSFMAGFTEFENIARPEILPVSYPNEILKSK